jgi:hypothetical protein
MAIHDLAIHDLAIHDLAIRDFETAQDNISFTAVG